MGPSPKMDEIIARLQQKYEEKNGAAMSWNLHTSLRKEWGSHTVARSCPTTINLPAGIADEAEALVTTPPVEVQQADALFVYNKEVQEAKQSHHQTTYWKTVNSRSSREVFQHA